MPDASKAPSLRMEKCRMTIEEAMKSQQVASLGWKKTSYNIKNTFVTLWHVFM